MNNINSLVSFNHAFMSYKDFIFNRPNQLSQQPIQIKTLEILFSCLNIILNKDRITTKDENKDNNSVDNLEWCTRNDNLRHAYQHELRSAKRTNNARCKLTEDDVRYIKKNYRKGDKDFGASALSKKFGVASQTICAVVSGQNWKE